MNTIPLEDHPQWKREPRIKLVPFDSIKLGTERRYLVKGIIPHPGLTVIWGPPKSGKSFWTFDLTMHVALDWEYRGRRVHQGPVVYCCFEGQSGIQARVEAFRQRFLSEDAEAVPFFPAFFRKRNSGTHLGELLAERKKRQAAEKRVKELEAVLRNKREEWVFRRSPAHRAN